MLPPAVGPLAEALAGHDLVLVAGSSVFPYYPNIPGDFLPAGAELVAITCDPDEAARAPMGDAIVADVALTLRALADELAEPSDREPPPARVELEPPPAGEQLSGGEVHAALAELFPPDGIVVLESPSSTAALRNQLRLSRPGLLLLQRQRRPRLRPVGGGRRAARPAPASGRVRARRGLGAVCDHGALDGRGL